MAGAPLVPTRYPAIYRRGSRFAYEWTGADGKRRRASAESLDEARRLKAEREEEARAGLAVTEAASCSAATSTGPSTRSPREGPSMLRRPASAWSS
jgi:hypothetical protein